MATYKQIQEYIKIKYGFASKSCWIAHMKELTGQNVKVSYNRIDINKRKYPCPPDKMDAIKEAFTYFNMIS